MRRYFTVQFVEPASTIYARERLKSHFACLHFMRSRTARLYTYVVTIIEDCCFTFSAMHAP